MQRQQSARESGEQGQPPPTTSHWNSTFDPGLLQLMQAQRARDPGWPPEYAWGSDLNEWLATPANITRIVAHTPDHQVLGHVGAGTVKSAALGSRWAQELNCPIEQLAEICRLIIDPKARRLGISGILTKRLVRELVDNGRVPVATALVEREASTKMMTSIGWRIIGTAISERTGLEQYLLVSPEKLVAKALENRKAQDGAAKS